MSDETSKVIDELAAEPQSAPPAEESAEEAAAQSPPPPADDASHSDVDQSATVDDAVEQDAAEQASTPLPPAGPASAEQPVSEQRDTEEAEPEEVKFEKPTSFTPMSVGDPTAEKAKKPASDEPLEMDWYILKVQSNRERSIADALRRKVAIEGLDRYFGDVVVPTEKVTEFKGGKKKVVERKLYPGYIVVNMHINDDTWFAVRETSGIGDFTGSGGKPTPMLPHEVARIVHTEEEETSESPKLNINFELGNRVKVKEGNFESFEGEVSAIDEQSGRITVMINIFGRSTPVELEYWQVEPM